ncbi:MAG: DUF2064 domain-containing protein [Polyangiales bacterium]
MTATLAVMARAPVPGRCKTRLAAGLGPVGAAALYRAMLLDSLAALARIPDVRRVVMAAPEDDGVAALGALAREIGGDWSIVPQHGEGLGARLLASLTALTTLTADGAPVVLLDSDSPTLPVAALSAALPSLGGTHALLGPCDDGGYWALGAPRAEPGLFEGVPWSTAEVAPATRARMRMLEWTWTELPTCFDVDEPGDLERLRAALRADPSCAPRSAAWLERAR